MDEQKNKSKFSEYTVISIIIAFILLIFSLFLSLTISREADFSLRGILWLLSNNPVIWILLLYTFLFPFAIFTISAKYSKILQEKQQVVDFGTDRINQVNNFTRQLINDNLDVEFKLTDENDELGQTLINLRNTLKLNYDNNLKIRKEEEQRNWLAEGSAHFSETLRSYIHDPDQLAFHVVKDLTKYVNAIQGGFYFLDDNDPENMFFNLSAFFAYDRKKFTDQKIKWGDGLIGTCALEKKTIHIKNMPENYITVTSGLGESNPNSLLIAPILYEDQVYGVLEFASFSKFEPNHITLIEKTAESVGATLSAVKTNLRTAKLLEESKTQTQILTSHEEEMRQNLEELQATQEESTRQSKRLVQLEEIFRKNIIHAEFDATGKFINGNSLFYSKFEYSNDLKLESKPINEFISEDNRDWFTNILNDLLNENKTYKGYLKHVTRTGKDLWIMGSLSTLLFEDNTVNKIILLGVDSTEERSQLENLEAVINSVNNTSIRLEMDINGNLIDSNQTFTDLFKFTQKDLKSLVIFDIINPIELESFNKRWDFIIHGNNFSGVLRCKSSKGEEIWLNGSFSFTMNTSHETDHVVFVGNDITSEKQLESKLHNALDTLKKQERQIKDSEKELTNKVRETRVELQNQLKDIERIKNLNEKILEETIDAIVITSNDNRISFINKAAEDLWSVSRNEVINNDIGILFPEKLTEKDELLASFIRPGDHKITGKRKKSVIIDKKGKEKNVHILLTKARVDNENTYMAYIQLI